MSKPIVFQVKLSEDTHKIDHNDEFVDWTVMVNVPRSRIQAECNVHSPKSYPHLDSNLWECEANIRIHLYDGFQELRKVEFRTVIFNCLNRTTRFEDNFLMYDVVKVEIRVLRAVGIRPERPFDFEEPGFSDVTFLVEEKQIHAHRSILSANSHYFYAMFSSNFAEKERSEIELQDVDYYEFIDVLNAVYSGSSRVTEKNISYFLKFADMYGLDRLMNQCEKYLDISKRVHVVDKINYADKYGFTDILKSYKYLIGSVEKFRLEMKRDEKIPRNSSLNETWQWLILHNTDEPVYVKKTSDELMAMQRRKELKDTALQIGDSEVLVNKACLSIHSPFFQRMFYGNTEQSTFFIEDDSEVFLELLEQINRPEKAITSENVLDLLKLATKYGVEFLINKCEKFLVADRTMSLLDKSTISENYGLCRLQVECLDLHRKGTRGYEIYKFSKKFQLVDHLNNQEKLCVFNSL